MSESSRTLEAVKFPRYERRGLFMGLKWYQLLLLAAGVFTGSVASATGGPGTGNGVVGGAAALVLGSVATVLGGVAISRSRRTAR